MCTKCRRWRPLHVIKEIRADFNFFYHKTPLSQILWQYTKYLKTYVGKTKTKLNFCISEIIDFYLI